MFENKKYDPVTAPVPGVDPKQRSNELKELSTAGDPLPPKPLSTEEKVIFKSKRLGIKIVR